MFCPQIKLSIVIHKFNYKYIVNVCTTIITKLLGSSGSVLDAKKLNFFSSELFLMFLPDKRCSQCSLARRRCIGV